MTYGVNDNLGRRRFVKVDVRVGQGCQAADGRVIRASADAGMEQEKIDDRLNAGLNTASPCGE
jgi:hypothetical protein